LKSSAHPLVEITVMRQPKHGRTLVHFVNLSGHSDTAYFEPVEMREVSVELAEVFDRARATVSGENLRVTQAGAYGRFMLPKLGAYEVVVLEPQ
jgi:hypothetical protein